MKLPILKKNSTILLESYQRNPFYYELLKDLPGVTHLETTSLKRIYNMNQDDDLELIIMFYQILNAPNLNLDIFESYRNSLSFVLELITLYKIVVTQNISLSILPNTTKKDQEIFEIISSALKNNTSFLNKIAEPLLKENLYYLESFEKPLWQLPLLKKINTINIPVLNNDTVTYKAFKALNKRIEIEAVARQILTLNLSIDKTMIICLNEDYYSLIKQIFDRYNLPYFLNKQEDKFQLIEQYIRLFSFWENPSTDTLLKCIEANCWGFNKPLSLIHLLEYYQVEYTSVLDFLPDQEAQNLKYHYFEIENLNNLIKETKTDLMTLKEEVKVITNTTSFENILNHLYNLVFKNVLDTELEALTKLKNTLENNFKYLEALPFKTELLIYLLENIKPTIKDVFLNQIIVTNQHDFFYPNIKHCFIVGGINSNYPNVFKFSGIIDETYLSNLPILSLPERTENYLNSLEKIFSVASNIYLSYPYSDYTGKPLTVAAEFEDLAKRHNTNFIEYIVEGNDYLPKNDYSINPKLLWSIICQDNTIYGSVSSFEAYTSCHYYYFLKHILNIKEYQLPYFKNNTLGTITHDLLETLINEASKQYPEVSLDQLNKILDLLFNFYQINSKTQQKENDFIKLRYLRQLIYWFDFLKGYEVSNTFIPSLVEHPFKAEAIFDDIKLILRGRIDRIDVTNEYFQIIDFKSSQKALHDNTIRQGLQLQLLTYLYFYSKETNLKPFGVYYSFLPNQYINNDYANITFRGKLPKIELFENNQNKQEFTKLLQLTGKTFGNPTNIFSDSAYVKDLKGKEHITNNNISDFNKVETFILEIYQAIVLKLKAGEIDCYPVAGACTYCPFKEICQYQGTQDKMEILTSLDNFKAGVKND